MKKILLSLAFLTIASTTISCEDDNGKKEPSTPGNTTADKSYAEIFGNVQHYPFLFEEGYLCTKEGEVRKGCAVVDDNNEGIDTYKPVTLTCTKDGVSINLKYSILQELERFEKDPTITNKVEHNPDLIQLAKKWRDANLSLGWKITESGDSCVASCNIVTGQCVQLVTDDHQTCDANERISRCDGTVYSRCVNETVDASDCAWNGEICVMIEDNKQKTECYDPCQTEGEIVSYKCETEDNQSTESYYECTKSKDNKLYYADKEKECEHGCDGNKCKLAE